jgi:hypothetical protein
MNIYTPNHDDELFSSLKEWCRNNPIDLKELGHEKIPAWNKGIPNSPETRRLCGLAAKKKVMTPEMIENYRQSKLGEKNPNFGGKSWTKEAREKLSKSIKGKKNPTMVEWHKHNVCYGKTKVVCPHCKKEGAAIVMQRWHFNNCKFKI